MRVAVQAPSGRNRQRWDFVFVEDPDPRAAVAQLWRLGLMSPDGTGAACPEPTRMDFRSDEWNRIASSLDRLARHRHEVPVLLIPCLRVGSRKELDTIRGQAGAWGSVIPAGWSFMRAARERGLGTAWTTARLSYEREMAELLGIPFDTAVQVALTPVAYTVGTDFRLGRSWLVQSLGPLVGARDDLRFAVVQATAAKSPKCSDWPIPFTAVP